MKAEDVESLWTRAQEMASEGKPARYHFTVLVLETLSILAENEGIPGLLSDEDFEVADWLRQMAEGLKP